MFGPFCYFCVSGLITLHWTIMDSFLEANAPSPGSHPSFTLPCAGV